MSQHDQRLFVWDKAVSASSRPRIHPAIDARDALAGDRGDPFRPSKLADNVPRRVEMIFAHTRIFAIIATIRQAKFAIFAI